MGAVQITIDLVLQVRAKTERQQSERTRRPDRERDDQRLPMEKELHCCEVFSGTISGSDEISKLVEDRETFFF